MSKLTEEQENIIEISKNMNRGEILTINACAGSGKTFILNKIASENKEKSFLYLAFNKSIAEEMKAKVKNNVDVKTIHSLAFSFTKKMLGSIKIINSYTIFDISKFFPNESADELFVILSDFNDFLKSNKKIFETEYVKILWNLVVNKELDVSHDFYLKYYFLYRSQKELEQKYDFLLLDEAQDTNAIMIDFILENNCSKILVGDTFQNIYGFNNTINAIEELNSNYKMKLSKNFRSKQEILDYADYFLLKYTNKNKSRMISAISPENIENNIKKTTAFIMRTNTGIIEFLNKIKEFDQEQLNEYCLIKNPKSIFNLIFDILFFKSNNFLYISKENSFLKKFNSMIELKNYAEELIDKELQKAILLSEKKYDFSELNKLAEKLYQNYFLSHEKKYFITNAHISKGLEWDIVELYKDFPNFKELKENIDKEKNKEKKDYFKKSFEQEINLFYVAITRAKFELINHTQNQIK
ncbi:hypothetical protein CDJ58_03655 [Campylobacter lari]|nr:ATP-dependent helicase [Campylobacter lari]EAK5748495.1 hypothetical protein [Campylobacter lari]EAK9878268.1 hypothetical protein [Campylobacter lari]